MTQPFTAYRRRIERVADPAAGTDIRITPTGTGLWIIRQMRFQLSTSAVAGSRYVGLRMSDGTTECWRAGPIAQNRPSTTEVFVADGGSVGATHETHDFGRQATAVAAAAAAGSVSLAVGDYCAGFTLSFQQVAAAVDMDVTLTNIAGGTMTYRVTAPVTGDVITVPFDPPIPAATALVAPTVNVPATVGGPAYSMAIYGMSAQASVTETIPMPPEGFVLPQGWVLSTATENLDAGDQFSAVTLLIEEYPSGPAEWSQLVSPTYVESSR